MNPDGGHKSRDMGMTKQCWKSQKLTPHLILTRKEILGKGLADVEGKGVKGNNAAHAVGLTKTSTLTMGLWSTDVGHGVSATKLKKDSLLSGNSTFDADD